MGSTFVAVVTSILFTVSSVSCNLNWCSFHTF